MSDASTSDAPPDVPDQGDRGWKNLTEEPGERQAFIGVVLLLVFVALMTVLFGLPGLFLSFLALALVIMALMLVIAMGE